MSRWDEKTRLRIIEKAILSRKAEERLLSLFAEGKLFGTVHTCIGQEFSGAVLTEFIQPGDSIFSNHRCHGHFLSRTRDVKGLFAEIMGKSTGVCAGRGGSQHLCKDGFYSNGIQGGIVPIAAGLALARKLQGEGNISLVFIGDGTLGEGVLYESLNLAAKWGLPLLIVLENNGYSQSTAQDETLAGDILARAEVFGIRAAKADTWNWEGLYAVAEQMVSHVRGTVAPGFLQIDTYRLKAHSKGDDTRPRHEVQPYEDKDPLTRLTREPTEAIQAILTRMDRVIDEAVAFAESSAFAALVPPAPPKVAVSWKPTFVPRKRLVKSLNETFKDLMHEFPQVIQLGEDICSPYGGAFKVTEELSALWPKRVLNTPISEAAITGLGCGLAMSGYRPFVEIMFGDFTGLAFDQLLNHAAKFEGMYNNQVAVNLVVRTPMGGGRGYGPTHSQTLDAHFMGIPGLKIVAINNLIDPEPIYRTLVTDHVGPVLCIENKLLYATYLRDKLPTGYVCLYSDEQFPMVYLKPLTLKPDLTILAYGGLSDCLVGVVDRLFDAHNLIAQVLCPTLVYPFSIQPYLGELGLADTLITVEEGQGFAGFGAEVVSQLSEMAPGLIRRVKRICPPNSCIPASGALEKAILPNEDNLVKKISEFLNGN
jgi:2-oxoisovalerate dehydrogenase E1 component